MKMIKKIADVRAQTVIFNVQSWKTRTKIANKKIVIMIKLVLSNILRPYICAKFDGFNLTRASSEEVTYTRGFLDRIAHLWNIITCN